MTQVGIKCPLVLSAAVDNLPCFTLLFLRYLNDIRTFQLFIMFCNIIMTGEPMHITMKERTAIFTP